nr:HepT-like ribonuclease domain-containing protein [Agrobacterium tumefaciens]
MPWIGIGNILRHEYHRIADDVVWAVVTEYVAPLRNAVEAIHRSVASENRGPHQRTVPNVAPCHCPVALAVRRSDKVLVATRGG